MPHVHLALDYIEEPLKDKTQLAAFARSSHVPLALDETLREPEAERYCKFADVYVLKPTLSGGMTGTIERSNRRRLTTFDASSALPTNPASGCWDWSN